MLRTYQIKWCIRLIVVLAISSLLVRSITITQLKIWEFLQYILFLSLSIVTCWFIHGYIIQHRVANFNNTVKHTISIILAMCVTTAFYYVMSYYFPHNHLVDDRRFTSQLDIFIVHLTGGFFLSVICFTLLNNLLTNETLQKTMLENELLKQAHLRAQLLSLQQQVSPHFLFNSLSTLKTLSHDQEAKDYIVQLSKVYRHLLNFNEYHLTTLKDELAFLKSYLYILNLRFEDSLIVSMDINDDYLACSIPPLSLQLLVENAIKHNITTPERPLKLAIFTNEDGAIVIENSFAPKQAETEGAGMGLQNINDRYELLIHKPIIVFSDQNKFSVTLPLLSV